MAAAHGVSAATGQRIWSWHNLKRQWHNDVVRALSMLDGQVIGDCMPRYRH